MTPEEELQKACCRVAVAEVTVKRALAQRTKVIRDLAARGITPTRMSRIYPLTVSRYHQIVNGYKPSVGRRIVSDLAESERPRPVRQHRNGTLIDT